MVGTTLKRRLAALAVLLTIPLSGSGTGHAPAAQAPAAGTAEVRTWYFYTVKWGFQDEFLDLFQRNHYPVLKARMEAGHYASVRTYTPRYHGDGRADWTFAVELVERPGLHRVADRGGDRQEALSRSGQVPPGRAAALRVARSALGYTADRG